LVLSAGQGYRLSSRAIKEAFNRNGAVMHLMLRYTQALITQMSQTAVCNRHHTRDKQLCRWLLLSMDRLKGNELVMTQELIANMLGVRREGVTEAGLKLQANRLIHYARVHIRVIDRPGCCRARLERPGFGRHPPGSAAGHAQRVVAGNRRKYPGLDTGWLASSPAPKPVRAQTRQLHGIPCIAWQGAPSNRPGVSRRAG